MAKQCRSKNCFSSRPISVIQQATTIISAQNATYFFRVVHSPFIYLNCCHHSLLCSQAADGEAYYTNNVYDAFAKATGFVDSVACNQIVGHLRRVHNMTLDVVLCCIACVMTLVAMQHNTRIDSGCTLAFPVLRPCIWSQKRLRTDYEKRNTKNCSMK